MPSRPAPPQPTVICFVRHGTTPTTGRTLPGRAAGLHLSEKGEQEAAAVAERLGVIGPVAAVYASPLERARETAKPIAARLGQRVRVERGLLECEFGEWTGKELKDLSKLPEWQTVQRHPSGFRFPSGESFVELQARLAGTVERLVARHPGQVFSRVHLLDLVWPREFEGDERTVDVHVARIRRVLDEPPSPRLIITVHGVGYKLAAPRANRAA